MEAETLKIILVLLVFFLIGITLFYSALYIVEKGMKRKVVVNHLFKEFSQKMWMTAGLGGFFFVCYFLLVFWGSYFKDPEWRLNLFFFVYERPVWFIYLGLFIFVCISVSIYGVRVIIKRLYNTKRKF
jgi:hypothetical protein